MYIYIYITEGFLNWTVGGMKSSDDISGHFCESWLCNCYCVKNQENCVEILGSYQINITIGLD